MIAISNSLNVSIDYLLGIESNESHENTDIHNAIGLNDTAINKLKKIKKFRDSCNFFYHRPRLKIFLMQFIMNTKSVVFIGEYVMNIATNWL